MPDITHDELEEMNRRHFIKATIAVAIGAPAIDPVITVCQSEWLSPQKLPDHYVYAILVADENGIVSVKASSSDWTIEKRDVGVYELNQK